MDVDLVPRCGEPRLDVDMVGLPHRAGPGDGHNLQTISTAELHS